MLALDDRPGEIQLDMLRGASPKLHNELVRILGITDAIQELGRYSYELADAADTGDDLPGMRRCAPQLFDRHRQHVARLRESFLDIRHAAKDALSRYSAVIAGSAGARPQHAYRRCDDLPAVDLHHWLFGMNFQTLTAHVQNQLWEFIVLGCC